MDELTCFKAYDVRGKLGEEINDDIAYRIGRAFAQQLNARRIVIGGDVRLTSDALKRATARGIMDAGADVIDLGVSGTEEIYFAAMQLDVDGGIEITASHNPMDYNGMKFIGRDATPIGDRLEATKILAQSGKFDDVAARGALDQISLLDQYVDHLVSYIDTDRLFPLTGHRETPLKLVVNAGNGAAGRVIDAIEARLDQCGADIEFVKIHHQPDGNFPNGIPNPLLPENRHSTAQAVTKHRADIGLAWDGDFDRCFFFDEEGNFIEGYYIVGLLAEAFLRKYPGEKIIYDPRLTWNTINIVKQSDGIPVLSKTGHIFIKQRMRKENAVYGGEMSAHHYFRDFGYCDSGMIPWLLIIELVCNDKKPLSEMVGKQIAAFPCSGELNYKVQSTEEAISRVQNFYEKGGENENPVVEKVDGLSVAFRDWRFNLRASNTEALLRLNVEARGNSALVAQKVNEIEKLIG
ncbi:MAG: phosphomannomutase CpsG [Hyphomicrobiales bacterium]|nr:phosphomannomutase CpsG [Hyphomicrobiales bacterium]